MKKDIFKQLHLWLSLPAGIFIVILCLTGGILVFQDEWKYLADYSFYHADKGDKESPFPLDGIIQTVQDTYPGTTISSMTLYADDARNIEFKLTGNQNTTLSVNPYSAQMYTPTSSGFFFTQIRSLHRWLLATPNSFINRTAGRTIIGISSLCLCIILISGLVFSIPRKRSQWKQALSIKRSKTSFTWWFTSHRALGIYCTLFLFIMAATGPMWSFGGYRSFISGIFTSPEQGNGRMGQGQGNQYRHGQNADPTQQANISPAIAWTAALQAIRQDTPRFSKITFQDNKALVQTKANAHPRACDTYTFDESGHITSVQYYNDLAARSKVMQYAYIIHTGKWGGFVTKLLYFLACIGGAYLTVSGYILYWKKHIKAKK